MTDLKNQFSLQILDSEHQESQFLKIIPLFLASYPSEHTRSAYRNAILEFLGFWKDKGVNLIHFQQLQRFHFDGWQRSLETASLLSPASISAKISAILSLSRFLVENEWLEKNPGQFVKLPKISKQKGKTQALSQDEITMILEHLEKDFSQATRPDYLKEDYRAWLLYGIFLTMATVGMRCSEFVNLKIKDFEKAGHLFRLHLSLKGGEEHSPLIPEYLAEFLQLYIKTCRGFAKREAPLFVLDLRKQDGIKREYLSKLITKTALKYGIDRKISAHSLRATVASMLHKNKIPVGEIKELLGHKSILTTMMYVRKTDEENESAALKSPLNQLMKPKNSIKP